MLSLHCIILCYFLLYYVIHMLFMLYCILGFKVSWNKEIYGQSSHCNMRAARDVGHNMLRLLNRTSLHIKEGFLSPKLTLNPKHLLILYTSWVRPD